MAPKTPATLGKRKRITREELERSTHESPSASESSASESESNGEDLQEIFRRAFEAKFAPLEGEAKKPKLSKATEEEGDDEENESEWSGLDSADGPDNEDDEDDESEDEQNGVEVIDYSTSTRTGDRLSKAEMRAFMSSKPPTSNTTPNLSSKPTKKESSDDPTETSHLKNDAALQKLLRDSHLLSASSSSGSSTPTNPLTLTGAARHKSTDLHLQALGAKGSVFTQKKMPKSQREAMTAKARALEERRRTEARENGIVLERESKVAARKGPAQRERGVGGPGVGKFRGGTLTLSKGDVASITGGGGGGRRGGRGGKGGRGGRGGRGGKRGRN
ncbi:hypothetical protein BS50DRAFT_546236 [Corynespora cassiicola Philippines]|uniref:Uncharacterized protein n=1 Tax=Corynespora cassiicola Philippines TaxID=1448308 RepID=A0A2T2P192_CORCC|nr:hypothetical protein BS50DRAFT_546236 [Corynespora cassiicola Philippines]